MKITISKNFKNIFLFVICLVFPTFNNYELTFAIWTVIALITLKINYSLEFIKYISVFIALLSIASIVTLFNNYTIYFIIRDITYMLKPILGLLIGYQLFKNNIKYPFQFLVYAGVCMAIVHIIQVSYGIVLEGARNVREIREYGGYFNDYEVYALVFLLFKNKFNLNISNKKRTYFIFILGISSFFYLARTNFIQFIVLVLAMQGYFVLNKKSIIVIGSTILFTLVSYFAIYQYNPIRNGKGLDEFLYKIKMAPGEAFSTKINRDDWRKFNDNYRSYENIRTIQQLDSNKSFLFGEGIGSQVDLKQKVYLGDMELRNISILHNGYMTVLLKTGIFGLIIYLYSVFFFFRKRNYSNQNLYNLNLLFVGTSVFLIISNWVFLGLFNLLDTKSMLIGFLFAYHNQLNKQKHYD